MPLPLLAASAGSTVLKVLTNKWVLIGLAVAALLLGIYLYGKNAGRTDQVDQALNKALERLPDAGTTLPQGFTETEGPVIAKRLYDAMSGWTLTLSFDERESAWAIAGQLSNDQLTVVNAIFNARYGDGESLYDWVKGESGVVGGLTGVRISNARDRLLTRLETLGLVKP